MPADLAGWRVLVTAGGTREPIDPVRYIGNRSSGKMGLALADSAVARGADVTVVSTVDASAIEAQVVRVETAQEMAEAVWKLAPSRDVIVMVAAVADFRPAAPSAEKIRRKDGLRVIELEPTSDILLGVSEAAPDAIVVGFAAEAGSLERVEEKLAGKGVDLLVANDVLAAGSGFGTDTNQVTLYFQDGSIDAWPLLTKAEVADRLWDSLIDLRSHSSSSPRP